MRRLTLVLVLACALVIPAASASAGEPLRTMSYNLQGNINRDNINLDAIAGVIRAQNAKIVGLQEVCGPQMTVLAQKLAADGYLYTHFQRTLTAGCGDYGIGFISKLPLVDVTATTLPVHNESRTVVGATLTSAGLSVRVYNTHLSPGGGSAQGPGLAAETDKSSLPRKIVMGDLNVEPGDSALNGLLDRGFFEVDNPANTPTHPASGPSKKIDHIFTAGLVAPGSVSVPNTQESDHRPIVANLELAQPLRPGGNGRIAFTSNRGGSRDIWTMVPGGGAPARLTTHSADDQLPAWSPDGGRIAFTSNRDGDNEIFVMDADGTDVAQLTHNTSDDQEPTWSPDSAKLAYRSNFDGDNEIWTINADGSGAFNVTNNDASDFAPDWSPDGGRIAYQRQASGDGNEVYLVHPDRSNKFNLTANDANDGRPSWSPDGLSIAFQTNRDGNFEVYTMSAGGRRVTRRTNRGGDDQDPAWARGGGALAFQHGGEVWTMNVGGSDLVNRTNNGADDVHASWQGVPGTRIDTAPPALTNQRRPQFAFSSPDAGATFRCSLDGAPAVPCTSPLTPPELADGPHSFEVVAVYGGGSGAFDTAPDRVDFTVDATPPVASIVSGPPAATRERELEFTLSAGDPSATIACSLDGAAYSPCGPDYTTPELADGDHSLRARATDAAGNVGPESAAWSFAVDNVAPVAVFDAGPDGLTNDSTPGFEFHADDAGAALECSLDGAAFAACASPHAVTAPLGDGDHALRVRARDAAGNVQSPAVERSFTVDTAAPVAVFDAGPDGLTNDATPSFAFEADDPGAVLECSLDGAAFATCTSPHEVTGPLADGDHALRVRARDAAGNVQSPAAERSFTVDTAAPAAVFDAGPSGPTNDSTPSFEFHADDSGATLQCSLDGAAFATCTSPHDVAAPLDDGDHDLRVRARDAAGNAQATPAERAFTVDTTAPEAAIAEPVVGIGSATVTFSAPDPDAMFDCSLDGAAFELCTSPLALTGLAAGDHELRVRAGDALGNVDTSPTSRRFTVPEPPPRTDPDTPPGDTPPAGGGTPLPPPDSPQGGGDPGPQPQGKAKLALTSKATPKPVAAAGRLTVVLTLRNTGTAPAVGVRVCQKPLRHMRLVSAAPRPASTKRRTVCFAVKSLAAGASTKLKLKLRVARSADPGRVSAAATASAAALATARATTRASVGS